MQTAHADDDGYLSWEEIRRVHPNEWVILVDTIEDPEDEQTLGGVVMAHSAVRREALDAIPRDRPTSCAIFYTGAIRRGRIG